MFQYRLPFRGRCLFLTFANSLMNQSPGNPPTDGDEERDDAVMGVAFRYSALALLGLLLIGEDFGP